MSKKSKIIPFPVRARLVQGDLVEPNPAKFTMPKGLNSAQWKSNLPHIPLEEFGICVPAGIRREDFGAVFRQRVRSNGGSMQLKCFRRSCRLGMLFATRWLQEMARREGRLAFKRTLAFRLSVS